MENTNEMELIKKAQREYFRKWNAENKEHRKAYLKKWRTENKDKLSEYNRNYWLKKAKELNIA